MSDTQTIMKFELLPNEILIECFEYLNASYIFHSFDQLNDRFNHLIRHISLCINLKEDVNKSIFDKFCMKILLNPQIKDQVYSLKLPSSAENNPAYLRTKTFLSFFSFEDFSNLQKFKTNEDVRLIPMDTKSSHCNWKNKMELSIVSFPKLRALSIPSSYEFDRSLENTNLSITNLTLGFCNLNIFYCLSKHVPMLKYLYVNKFTCSEDPSNKNTKESCNGQYCLHLKQLIICYISGSFSAFETFVQLTPNLKSLTISGGEDDMIDAPRWERLITSLLPYLDIIQFKFYCLYSKAKRRIIIKKFNEFQTDFWQKQHDWFTEYAVVKSSAHIYTIPYALNWYNLTSNYKRYRNNFKKNVNTFVNLTNLTLNYATLPKKCEDYFSNVTSLVLHGYPTSLTIEPIVNPFHLKHLDISPLGVMNISLLLLKIFEQTPQLFALSVSWNQLSPFFNNGDLCKYLNKMVKRLHITEFNTRLVDGWFQREQFYEVFSNIEHLQFEYGRSQEFLFSLHRLPKLSTLNVKWKTEGHPESYISQFVNEVKKLNVIYDINFQEEYDMVYNSAHDNYDIKFNTNRYEIKIRMWFRNNMS